MKKIIIHILILTGFFCVTNAQSIYSIPGIGELTYNNNVRVNALGGLGIAVEDEIVTSVFNPCSIIALKNTSFYLGGKHSRVSSNYYSSEFMQTITRFAGAGFGLKVRENMGIAMVLSPYSDLNYSFKLQDDEETTKSIRGNGGLNTFSFAAAYKLKNLISLGLSFNYYFGNIDETYRIDFTDNTYTDAERIVYASLKGLSTRGGILLSLKDKFKIGFVYNTSVTLDGEQGIKFYEDSTGYISKFKYKLPSSFGFGLLTQLTNKMTLNIDFYKNLYKNTKIDGTLVPFHNNSNHYGIGLEYRDSDDLRDPYKKRISYRLGFNFGNFYINDLNNNKVNEFYISTGIGLPFLQNKGRIDISFQFGKRGSKSLVPGVDNIFRIFINIAGSEIWFVDRTL